MKLFCLLVSVFLGVTAWAETLTSPLLGGTNNTAAATTNAVMTNTTWFTLNEEIAIVSSFKMTGAATVGGIVYQVDRGISTNLWETNYTTFTNAPNGTNTVVRGTNFYTHGYPYWRVGEVRNNTTNACTNQILVAR